MVGDYHAVLLRCCCFWVLVVQLRRDSFFGFCVFFVLWFWLLLTHVFAVFVLAACRAVCSS
jgi:hypothetical protein